MSEPQIDTDLIDEAVLALLFLTLHRDGPNDPFWQAWKSFDWDALEKGYISDPRGQAKSVVCTEQGLVESERLLHELFDTRSH